MLQKRFYFEQFVPSNEHAAEVIGYKGYKIKKISRETHTYIQCPSPTEFPIFKIFGDNKANVDAAKDRIFESVAHFDKMRKKKRQINLKPDEKLQTVSFRKSDVPCIIGRKGKQIKKIMAATNVVIISPDTNKEPIFIIIGREHNVDICVTVMKIIVLCISGINYFIDKDINLICDYFNNNLSDKSFSNCMQDLIDIKGFEGKFAAIHRRKLNVQTFSKTALYKCWNCKRETSKIARTLCNHIISCDQCIAKIYADIYLKCKACNTKIENFLIEFYNDFIQVNVK